jgi:23S rRNA (cytosine1962-C5)-methyltransferase
MTESPKTPANDVPTLVLARNRERSALRRHPWVFSGAIAEVRGDPQPGATVRVCAADRSPLGVAAYSPSSQIRARFWDFAADTAVDRAFFARRVQDALALRAALLPRGLTAYRVIHAESDGLPGVVVDRYADQLVLAATSAGAALHRASIADALCEVTGLPRVYERSEGDVLELEGIPARHGALRGPAPPAELIIEEHGVRYAVDPGAGHKTGFYLDQRDNRALVRELAAGRDVLDCFCYSGGFSVNAVLGGARSVCAVDSSDEALSMLARNARLNGLPEPAIDAQRGDVFAWLRKARDSRRSFDLIVLDPPKLAPTARHAERAARAYKDLNLLGFKLLRPGGVLLTFSCSGGVSVDLFQKIVASAAADAGVDAAFARRLGPGADHPVALAFPEGEYLKGLVCRRA